MFLLGGLVARERRVQKSEKLYASAKADLSNNVPPEVEGLRRVAVDFSRIPLQPASPPLTMLQGDAYVTDKETVLTVLCHDRLQSRVSIYMEGKSLFHVEGARWGTSWSWRRRVFEDATGAHLFDFRHESVSLRNGWLIQNGEQEKLCSLVHKKFFTKTHSGIAATLRTQGGEEVMVDMEPSDECKPCTDIGPENLCNSVRIGYTDAAIVAVATTVSVGNQTVACIYKIAMETSLSGYDKDRSLYKIHVAAGVDLSFVRISPSNTQRKVYADNVKRLWSWQCAGLKWALFGHNEVSYAEVVGCW